MEEGLIQDYHTRFIVAKHKVSVITWLLTYNLVAALLQVAFMFVWISYLQENIRTKSTFGSYMVIIWCISSLLWVFGSFFHKVFWCASHSEYKYTKWTIYILCIQCILRIAIVTTFWLYRSTLRTNVVDDLISQSWLAFSYDLLMNYCIIDIIAYMIALVNTDLLGNF